MSNHPNFRSLKYLLVVYVFSGILLPTGQSVDRSNFKTCDQSSFCKRHRKQPPSSDIRFAVLGDTVKFEGDKLSAVLENRDNQRRFVLTILGLADSRVRLSIDELNPIRQRWRPLDALDGIPEQQKFKSHAPGAGSSMLITSDGNKLVLHYRPFRLDAYSGLQDLVLSLNSQGLLKFEHYRQKPNKPEEEPSENTDEGENKDESENKEEPVPPETDQESKKTEEDNEQGMWEEDFKSHHDSKPFGPASVGMDISFIGFQHVFGLPEHADSFTLRTTTQTDPYRLYNLDVFEYELHNTMALYGAVPYIVAHSTTKTVGVLWLNAAETWVDVKSSTADKGVLSSLVDRFRSSQDTPQVDTHFISESGVIDVFLFLGPGPKDVSRQFSKLTGVMPLPPLFGIAYHQCRWNYNDMEDVRQVDAGFDEHDIPYDVLWLDIEHTDGKKYFTWDPHKFSDPKGMIEGLSKKGRKMVTIIDPHIKKDDGYKVYKEAKDNGYFVKNKDGNDYEGWCWPGASYYLDFLNPVVRDYWAKHFRFDEYEGSTKDLFVWNDMNEPSVFNGPEVTMYKDCKHFGELEHRDIHNIYGFYHHASTFKGLMDRSEGKIRPFLLTRSFFVGSQRYSAVWTGDNMADWAHLQISIPMMLSLSVSGIPMVGADVGGFFRNPDEELLVRWYQTGAFSPFFRAHAHLDCRRREPWLFSDDTKRRIRNAIRKRYRLLPFWYTVFREHELTGLPVMRPMWLEFPADEHGIDEDKQFFIGSALLVRPVLESGAQSVSVYLPGETVYYDFDDFSKRTGPGAVYVHTDMDKVPVFIRGGTIVPTRERIRRASSLMSHDPITIYVALSRYGDYANGTIYLDDGETFAYKNGEYLYRKFEYRNDGDRSGSLTSKSFDPKGKLKSDVWIERIVFLGLQMYPRNVHLFVDDYKPTELAFEFDQKTFSMVVRRPKVEVNKDWRLDIHG